MLPELNLRTWLQKNLCLVLILTASDWSIGQFGSLECHVNAVTASFTTPLTSASALHPHLFLLCAFAPPLLPVSLCFCQLNKTCSSLFPLIFYTCQCLTRVLGLSFNLDFRDSDENKWQSALAVRVPEESRSAESVHSL